MKRLVTESGNVVVENVREANTFWKRFCGLMFNKKMPESDALLIFPCKSIHCCFMYFPIDILFLSKERRIVYMIEQMKPWTFSPYIRQASGVLECYPGTIAKYNLCNGDYVELVEANEELSHGGDEYFG